MKLTGFILAIFYFLSVTGYGLEFHYCLGKVTDVNYALLDTSCICDEVHSESAMNCCEEKEFFIQLDEDHQASGSSKIEVPLHDFTTLNLLALPVPSEESLFIGIPERGPPVPDDRQATLCSFVFYG